MSIIDQVLSFLEEEGCDAVVLKEDRAVRTGLQGENGEWICDIELVPMSPEVYVLGIMSYPDEEEWDALNEDQMQVARQLANRINFEYMLFGSFEIDPKDGSWRLRTSLAFTEEEFSVELLKHAMFINWTEMDYYYPLLGTVLIDGEDFEDTWADFEDQMEEEVGEA